MKTRRALSSSVSSSRGGSESDQLLPHVDLEFFDSLSDLEGFQAAPIDIKQQQQQQLFAIAGSTDEDDALKQEPLDLTPMAQMPPLKAKDGAKEAQLAAVAPPRRAKFSAEVRKARHRDRMQRTRMAEKKDLEVKRGEMEQLEVRLKDSIDGYLRQGHDEAEHDDFFALCEGRRASAQQLALRTSLPPAVIQRKYVGLVVQQDQIKKENAQLATRILDHQKYEKLVMGELERTDEPMVARESERLTELPASSAMSGQNGGYWLSFTENEPHLYFEPLSWTVCQSATEATYNKMLTLQRGIANPAAAPSEGFGWRFAFGTLSDDRSRRAGDTRVRMQHQFVKRIAPQATGTLEPITVDSIGANMWEIMNSSELYSKIYKTDMVSKVLQQVDDHTSVLLRTYPDERREMRSRFLSLITRIAETVVDAATGESRRRVVVLMAVLDPDACLKTGTDSSTSSSSSGQASWLSDGVAYLAFTEISGGQEIELEYGGYMDVASEALQPAVVRNILEALMRLERAATRSEADATPPVSQPASQSSRHTSRAALTAQANVLDVMVHDAANASSLHLRDGARARRGSMDSTGPHAQAESAPSAFYTAVAVDSTDLLDRDGPCIDEQLDAVAKAALKRKRHRDIVARSRMRQKATIEGMRAHEAALCKQLHRLLIASDRQRVFAADDHVIERAVVHRAHEAYVAGVAVQESIRQENEFLQDRIDDLAKFRQMTESEWRRITRERQECAANAHQALPTLVPATSADSSADESKARGYWVYFCGHEDPIYYEPISVQSCEASMQVVYQRMIDLHQDFSLARIALHETHCFGWKVQRPLHVESEHDRRLLRFQFTKTIRCVDDSMDAIVNRTWLAFHNPALYAKIYSTVVVTRVVQRVNEHMTVLIQNAPNPDGLTNIRYLNILAKMSGVNERRERVVALVKTIVDPSKTHVQPSAGAPTATTQPHDIEWMKHGFSFLLLTDVSGDSHSNERLIQMHYGTHYECVNEAHARYLMLEVLGLATRWEQLVLPTRHLTF